MTRRTLVTALAVLLAVAGCGIPTDDAPVALAPPPTPTPGATETAEEGTTYQIFLVTQESPERTMLVPVEREIDTSNSVVIGMVRALADGPTDAELEQGYTTALLAGVTVGEENTFRNGSVLTLDLVGLELTDRTAQKNALAQIVYTLTTLADVDAIVFTFDGEPGNVPTDTEDVAPNQAVDTQDYASYAP